MSLVFNSYGIQILMKKCLMNIFAVRISNSGYLLALNRCALHCLSFGCGLSLDIC